MIDAAALYLKGRTKLDRKTVENNVILALRVSLILVPLLMGVLLFEVMVRIAGTDVNPNPNWRYHPVLGWSQEPDARYDYLVSGEEVHVEFNSLGFRDVERSVANPDNSRRIVVVGDSFCEAVEVNLEDTFHQRLQKMLNQKSDERWEVINLGVGDFGSVQELIALTDYGLAYAPEIVVFQIFPLNDICNNSLELHGLCKSPNDPYRPYFKEENGKLTLTSAQPVRNFLRRYLATYGVLERATLTYLLPPPDPEDNKYRQQRMIELGYAPVDPLLVTYMDADDQIAPVAAGWRILERVLAEMDRLLSDREVHLIPLVIPFEARVGPAWAEFAESAPDLVMIPDYPERRLRKTCERLGLDPIFMKDVFEQNLDLFFPTRGGHLNPESHRLVAEQIYNNLRDHGLIR